jgi:hypothetical protein
LTILVSETNHQAAKDSIFLAEMRCEIAKARATCRAMMITNQMKGNR